MNLVWVSISVVMLHCVSPARAENSHIIPFSQHEHLKQLTRDELREIFFGRRSQWPDGAPMKVYVLPDQHPLHIRFAKDVLGVYPYQLRSAWDRMVFSGTGVPPVAVDTIEQMRKQIEQTAGAIGYIEQ